jgi:fatty-acyl-CoA synthase
MASAILDSVGLQARLQPDRLAALELSSGRSWTYAELDRSIAQCARVLVWYGVRRSDRVASLGRNRVELISLHLACARLGAIYVPINWRLAPREVETLLEDAQPTLMVGGTHLELVSISCPRISLDDFAAQVAGASEFDSIRVQQHDPSLILYTSGTSGRPKGVLLTEHNIAQTAYNFSVLGRVTHQSTFLCDSPMFHIIGLIISIRPPLLQGGAIVVSDGFEPARTLERLADPHLAITHYFCVPQMAHLLRNHPTFAPEKLHRLTALFTGGAPHSQDNIRAWLEDGIAVVDGFGMSEAGTVFGMPIDRRIIAAKAGSVGVPVPGVGARIVDDAGRECADNVRGELQLRGPNVCSGYWQRPVETVQAFTPDGWFRTGDIALRDPDGFHYIVDRKKDMFISGGENVYPAEVEAALCAMPGIVEVAVVGVPDTTWGEVGHAAVVCLPDTPISAADVAAYLSGRLGRYKIPKHVTIVTALPRTGSGKVQKGPLRALLSKPGAPGPPHDTRPSDPN